MIAVLGASGQLGSAFVRFLGDSCLPVTRNELDLADTDAIAPWIASAGPELVINCAAYTAVDAAESDPIQAGRVNGLAVQALAEASARSGARFVTFSTDYVFDGEKPTEYLESDLPNPLNVYGRTKLEGERLALSADPEALVVRTSWVMSATHDSFASRMLELISSGPVRVVDDQHGHPTLVDDLVVGVLEATNAGVMGVLHLANAGETTWFGLAREIAELAGLDAERVSPTSTSEFPRPARRPLNSVLGSERVDELMISPLPHYRSALEAAIRQLLERLPGVTSG